MSNEPVEPLLEAVIDDPGLAAGVEHHLDRHPLLVDEAEVAVITRRLGERMAVSAQPTRSRWWWAAIAIPIAAAGLLALQSTAIRQAEPPARPTVEMATSAARIEAEPGVLRVAPSDVDIAVLEPTRLVTYAGEQATIVLVQEGRIEVDDAQVEAGHWVLATQVAGEAATVVFRDGEAPPALNPDIWRTERVHAELREARIKALPSTTHETLEAILEQP